MIHTKISVGEHEQPISRIKHSHFLTLSLMLAMECALLLTGVISPLRTLIFYMAYPGTLLETWLLLPTRLLFPGWKIISSQPGLHPVPPDPFLVSVSQMLLLLGSFTVLFVCYLLAVRYLPQHVTCRYILCSTFLLGCTCMLIPIVLSQDLFSYIAYARMGVIHHLNPLTTLPVAIPTDPVYPWIFWVHQPSAYGPLWIALTSMLQWISLLLGFQHILSMVLLLRFLGLLMHLGSVGLIWLISGKLQHVNGILSPRTRLYATLAFAWNPLLLIEACVNAHNDTTILFLVLLALWSLQLQPRRLLQPYLLAAVLLALVACIKITLIVLLPGFLLFLFAQRSIHHIRRVGAAAALYGAVVLLCYAPFWQQGQILHVFQVNPGTTRDVSSPYEFFLRLYASLRGSTITLISADRGTASEIHTHQLSIALFIVVYGAFCLYTLRHPRSISTFTSFIRWIAFAWLLYCLLGSPWFWPWYMTTYFGLFALIVSTGIYPKPTASILRLPLAIELLTFGMLIIYCFFTWAAHIIYLPHLHQFQWAYVRGILPWVIPLLALRPPSLLPFIQKYRASQKEKRVKGYMSNGLKRKELSS